LISQGGRRHRDRPARRCRRGRRNLPVLVSDDGGFITGQTIHVNGSVGFY